jgi:hypothetical protein
MIQTTSLGNRRAKALVALLDIPDSYYELARARYRSLADWLLRPESLVATYEPSVYPQGSFNYGTVIRPLFKADEYDLDVIAEFLLLTKDDKSQKEVKQLLGREIVAYATANNFNSPPEEKHRCWRLDYADKVKFHMDILPAIPEDEGFKQLLVERGVDSECAVWAIAITDKRHPAYAAIQRDWPRSNPKGFAKWFKSRMRSEAQHRLEARLRERAFASVDDIPTWEWKTPLQRAIQILKRHRDVMFKDNCDVAPISMIITTLAAHAYEGEDDLYDALMTILERMPTFVRPSNPRVPNPVNPGEDFADRWNRDSRLEANFWKWHMQAKIDLEKLASHLDSQELRDYAEKTLRLNLDENESRELASIRESRTPYISLAPIIIASAPKPWGHG